MTVKLDPLAWVTVLLPANGAAAMWLWTGLDAGVPLAIWIFEFTAALLLLMAAHEVGHAIVAVGFGERVRQAEIGVMRLSIMLDTTTARLPARQFWISLAGPGLQLLLALLCVSAQEAAPAIALAGLISTADALINLLPLDGTDGHKLVASGIHCLAGRGRLNRPAPLEG